MINIQIVAMSPLSSRDWERVLVESIADAVENTHTHGSLQEKELLNV